MVTTERADSPIWSEEGWRVSRPALPLLRAPLPTFNASVNSHALLVHGGLQALIYLSTLGVYPTIYAHPSFKHAYTRSAYIVQVGLTSMLDTVHEGDLDSEDEGEGPYDIIVMASSRLFQITVQDRARACEHAVLVVEPLVQLWLHLDTRLPERHHIPRWLAVAAASASRTGSIKDSEPTSDILTEHIVQACRPRSAALAQALMRWLADAIDSESSKESSPGELPPLLTLSYHLFKDKDILRVILKADFVTLLCEGLARLVETRCPMYANSLTHIILMWMTVCLDSPRAIMTAARHGVLQSLLTVLWRCQGEECDGLARKMTTPLFLLLNAYLRSFPSLHGPFKSSFKNIQRLIQREELGLRPGVWYTDAYQGMVSWHSSRQNLYARDPPRRCAIPEVASFPKLSAAQMSSNTSTVQCTVLFCASDSGTPSRHHSVHINNDRGTDSRRWSVQWMPHSGVLLSKLSIPPLGDPSCSLPPDSDSPY